MRIHLNYSPAAFALYAASIGVSLSSVVGGSSALYLGSIGIAGIFSIVHISRARQLNSLSVIFLLGLTAWLFTASALREIMPTTRFAVGEDSELPKIFAVAIVILVAISSSFMPKETFRRSFLIVALVHVSIISFGLLSGRTETYDPDMTRFAGAGFRTSAWAEVATGTIMAATLSANRVVIPICFLIGGYAIILADMRTTLLATIAIAMILLVAFVSRIRSKKFRILIWSLVSLFIVLAMVSLSTDIKDLIWTVLSLDDPHRGISSGFSNRFENVRAGFDSFTNAFILGAGFSNPIVNYTHNGYVLTLAQMGAPLAMVLFFLLTMGLFRAARNREVLLLAVIFGLVTFYMGQPRNINFQLCPLVGIIAVVRALFLSRSPKSVVPTSAPTPLLKHRF